MAHSDPALKTESPLTLAELPAAEALVHEAGWNQTAADWRLFLDLGTVHAVRTSAGRVVATAATLPYGGRFAWISLVLVASDHRHRGLATRLLRRCIGALIADDLVPILDATPDGRKVYHALGFEDAWGYHRLASRKRQRTAVAAPISNGVAIHPITNAIWPALCQYDAAAFGADRSILLARLRGRLPAAELYAEQDGRIAGFLAGRDGRTAAQFGPLIAQDEATAQALLAHALSRVDAPVYLDIADSKTGLLEWLAAQGFARQRPLTRMLYQRRTSFDDTARTFAVAGPEFG